MMQNQIRGTRSTIQDNIINFKPCHGSIIVVENIVSTSRTAAFLNGKLACILRRVASSYSTCTVGPCDRIISQSGNSVR